jgi:glycerol kinase
MFSAVKAAWLLQSDGPAAEAARAGRLVIGTIDAWLLSRFARAPDVEPAIEIGNASRTQLLNVAEARWDDDLLNLFGIPRAALPRLTRSTGPFPAARGLPPLADGTPVLAVMGDSHAALFAHGAFAPGQVKATYGTGSSVMGLIARPEALGAGACLTIGWQTGDDPEGRPAFAAEGNIRATGAALRWMAGILGMSVDAMTALGARSESRGAVLVPGFTGLGAPWWDRDAVGLLTNLALDTGPPALARAAMEMQADALGCVIHRSEAAELSALGVAHMAGLGAGFWGWETLRALPRPRDTLTARLDENSRASQRAQWQAAVDRARSGGGGRPPVPGRTQGGPA